MDVENQQLFMRPICGYYNGCKKLKLLRNLYAGIAMDVRNQQLLRDPICGYCNGCKKLTTITRPYM